MTDRKMIYLDDAINALEREKTYSAVYKYGYTQTDYFKQYNMGLTDGIKALNKLPSAQPEQIARDIATIIENEKDMRVISKNAEHTETHSCECQRTGTHDWIPVTEALPRDDEEVIVTCLDDSGDTPYSYTAVAWHYNGMWVCDNMRCLFVIAWLPMPDPYKGEE